MSCLNNNYYTRWMSVSEQHISSIFRVDCHEDKGSMFCEDEDSSHLRCDAVSFGQQFMMIWRVIECSKHGTTCSTTQHHIPKDASLRLHVSEDLTSHIPVNCHTFSYHSVVCLTVEMWSLLQGIYRVIHKSLRNFRTRLRNNQDIHGRKEHINR